MLCSTTLSPWYAELATGEEMYTCAEEPRSLLGEMGIMRAFAFGGSTLLRPSVDCVWAEHEGHQGKLTMNEGNIG